MTKKNIKGWTIDINQKSGLSGQQNRVKYLHFIQLFFNERILFI